MYTPAKNQCDGFNSAIDKVVSKILEKSVVVNDIDNLVELDPGEHVDDTKTEAVRSVNDGNGRRKLYNAHDAPKRKPHVFERERMVMKLNTTVIEAAWNIYTGDDST